MGKWIMDIFPIELSSITLTNTIYALDSHIKGLEDTIEEQGAEIERLRKEKEERLYQEVQEAKEGGSRIISLMVDYANGSPPICGTPSLDTVIVLLQVKKLLEGVHSIEGIEPLREYIDTSLIAIKHDIQTDT
jgi:hypothetical protein